MSLHGILEHLTKMTDPRRGERIEHPPRAPFVGFPGGEPKYRAMRLAAALACRAYNDLAEDASADDREAAYRAITSSGSSASNIPLQNSPAGLSSPSVGSYSSSEVTRVDNAANTPPSSSQHVNNAEPIASLAPTIIHSDEDQHENNYAGYGKCPYIKGPLFIDYGTNVRIEGTTFINRGCVILDTPVSRLQIGKKCSIGPNVSFYCVTHPLDPNERHNPDSKNSSEAADIVIGDYVWLGGNVTVLPGVSIGEGCVIGAGSVVTKSMPPYVLAFGNPARIRRRIPRSNDGTISQTERALAIKAATTSIPTPLPTTASTSMTVFANKPSVESATMEVGGPIECPKFAIVMQQIQFLKRVVLSLVVAFFVLVVSVLLGFMWRRNLPHTFPGGL